MHEVIRDTEVTKIYDDFNRSQDELQEREVQLKNANQEIESLKAQLK